MNKRRPPRTRRVRPAKPPTEVALMPGVCIDEQTDIDAMMKATHDQLLEGAGRRRHSAVWWRQYRGAEAPATFEDLFGDNPAQEALDAFRQVFAELGDRAVLVVAYCDVVA